MKSTSLIKLDAVQSKAYIWTAFYDQICTSSSSWNGALFTGGEQRGGLFPIAVIGGQQFLLYLKDNYVVLKDTYKVKKLWWQGYGGILGV